MLARSSSWMPDWLRAKPANPGSRMSCPSNSGASMRTGPDRSPSLFLAARSKPPHLSFGPLSGRQQIVTCSRQVIVITALRSTLPIRMISLCERLKAFMTPLGWDTLQ